MKPEIPPNFRGEAWKQVVHIEDRKGPRGGELWYLTLECGHHHTTSKKTFKLLRNIFAPIQFAPKRVKCLVCSVLAGIPSANPPR